MANIQGRIIRLEKLLAVQDGDVQIISVLMDKLAGILPGGEYEREIKRLATRGFSFPQSSELRTLLVGGNDES
ncbi:hypothetical protein QEG60_003423 [Pluralibacter gergoviae]|uniref:hypothetical protein n=1 Tax=Pluralibacter gergoviae TaxID=61647 RepID=UPI000A37400C|nr:hypothetical protein [Pluralibacter gergoviae]EKV3544703.1 hypothetical protein [Pluralibacter gergoviae]EKV9900330.1 hypothetical protein [Pluralibacter gergoviae]EKV9930861.1 hypothetical protein [Pluralibacter gergoviae]OUF43690.1 hypothetical protein AZ034_004355 [Pluralibacter gergoviae]OUF55451.1 hypothetical protein AZ044_001701 [Pluralibacter gergoviae]